MRTGRRIEEGSWLPGARHSMARQAFHCESNDPHCRGWEWCAAGWKTIYYIRNDMFRMPSFGILAGLRSFFIHRFLLVF